MTVAIIILSVLLLSSWVNIYIIGKDDQFHWDEWLGCIVSILTTPIIFLGILRPIVNKIYVAKQKKKMQKRVDK